MITVIVPTADRPELLRTALSSIVAQTAVDKIGCVIVSENGVTRRSEQVCAEFLGLPVTYRVQEPAVDALAHGAILYDAAAKLDNTWVAVLHDDDWWAANHLENAMRALSADASAVAYWASGFAVSSERAWFTQCWSISCWMAAGFPPSNQVVKLGRREAALACVGGAPGIFSSLVARKGVLRDAFASVGADGNLLDNDRLLFLELAKRGPCLVQLVPEVFSRRHPEQAQRAFTSRGYRECTAATTRTILAFAQAEGFDPIQAFVSAYRSCPSQHRDELMAVIAPGVLEELRRHNPVAVHQLLRAHRSRNRLVRLLCPPIAWGAAREMKARMQRARGTEYPARNGSRQ